MLLNGVTMPDGYSVYGHQVAGHRFEAGKQGMLLDGDGKLLKPIQAPPRGEREVEFYQTVFGRETSDKTVLKLRTFVPTFYGVKHVVLPNLQFKADNYIILEDLTRHFDKPCILDIKIGRCVTDHLATQAKRERAERKYPEQVQFGFRILGMKLYNKSCKNFQFYDKTFGKNLKTHEEVLTGLQKFFCQEEHGKGHIEEILEQLRAIRTWALQQRTFRLYSSSILIMYEGNRLLENCFIKDNSQNDFCIGKKSCETSELGGKTCTRKFSQNECTELIDSTEQSGMDRHRYDRQLETTREQAPRVSINLVDFAHTYMGYYSEPDENYLYGLHNLICYFEQMVR